MQKNITVFTDGASSGNPGPGGWAAVVAYGETVTELGGGEVKTTNNRMELKAVLESLKFVIDNNMERSPVTVYTDSSYVAKGVTAWIPGWKRRNWTNQAGDTIANVDLWQEIAGMLANLNLKMVNVSGHSGVPGNERCDEIATGYAKGLAVHLYHGKASEYGIDLENVSVDADLKKSKDRRKEKAFSYLSLVDGELRIHSTWNDCKKRVEGVKDAKYKKATSKIDEDAIRTSWGV